MTTLEELEKLREAASGRWFVGGPIGDPWQVVCMEDSDDDYALFECSAPNAALIVAAINALPGLLESAKRVERLEAALRPIADLCDWIGIPDDDSREVPLKIRHIVTARRALKGLTP